MIEKALAGALLGGLTGYMTAPSGREWEGAQRGAIGGALEGLGAPRWAISAALDATDHRQPREVISDVVGDLAAYHEDEHLSRSEWLDIWTDAAGSKQRQPGIGIYNSALGLAHGNG